MATQRRAPSPALAKDSGSRIILCADDYALSDGVSRGILELAAAKRLSATSVLVTAPSWPDAAPHLRPLRAHVSVGLHFDLTLGPPLGAIPHLAPDGQYRPLGKLVADALLRRLPGDELRAEIERQLDRFERVWTFPPDHIDGHQHVHALPGVRNALIEVVARRYRSTPPLLRDPADPGALRAAPHLARTKALGVAALTLGFARATRRSGLPVNHGFSGFSNFDARTPYAAELQGALAHPGPLQIVMCHPGYPDAELARRDPVVERRRAELDALLREPGLPERIWRPTRAADGPPIDWQQGRG